MIIVIVLCRIQVYMKENYHQYLSLELGTCLLVAKLHLGWNLTTESKVEEEVSGRMWNKINIFDFAGYTPDLFEHEPLNIFGSIDTVLFEKLDNNWNDPIFHQDPKTPKPWVEYYRQSAINGELLELNNIVFKAHQQSYYSFYDKWDCNCREEDKTEWCYCEENTSLAKCSQW